MVKRQTPTSKRAAPATKRLVKASQNAALDSICASMAEAAHENKGKVPYGYVTDVVKEWHWLTRNIINKAYMKYRKMCDVTGNMSSRCNGILNDITVSGVVTVTSDLSDSQRENSESGVSSTESSGGSSTKRSKGGRHQELPTCKRKRMRIF